MVDVHKLAEQRDKIDRQIAAASKDALAEALEIVSGTGTAKLVVDIEAVIDRLPVGQARQQLGNIVSVVGNVRTFFDAELRRVTALIDAGKD